MEIYAAGRDGHVYQFYTDGSPPANPIIRSDTHPIPATWYNRSTVHVLWNDTGQDISGIKGYSVLWDNVPNTLPKEKIDFGPTVQEAFSPKLADRKDWYFHIRSCDGAGNWNRTTATFGPIFIDTTPPADLKVAIDDGAGCTNDEDAVLSAEASDDQPGSGPAWMSFSNDGQSWGDWEQFCATRPGWSLADSSFGGTDVDGPKEVWLKVKDLAGNEVAAIHRAKAEIFLDRVAPGGLGLTIEDGAEWTNRAEVTVAFHASDPEPASGLWRYTLSNDGISWSEWMDWTDKAAWSLTEGAGGIDSDGAKSVYLRVSDRAGNIGGPVSATIFLDRRPPGQLGLIINGGAGFTNASEVSLAVHVADPEPGSAGLEMAFSNDGSEFSPWEPAYDTRDNWSLIAGAGGQDSDGSKTVQLRTRDAAGNLGGPVNGSIFLDRVNPDGLSITINGGAKYTNGLDVNLSLSAKDAEPSSGLWTMQFSTDGVSWTEWEPFSSCRTYHLDGPEGPRTVHFRVKDRAGNVGGEATATVILDATPPLITGVTAAGISSRSAVIMWQSDEDADSAVEYGPTGAYGMSAVNGTFMTSHSLLLKGLTPSTTYHFRVASRDKAGNGPAMSADMAFTTTAKDDFVPPMISDVRVLGLSDRQAVVGWNTNEPADSSADWGRTGFYDRTARDDRFTLVHSLTLEGLSPSTSYHFRVGSSDSSGNGPSFSPDFTFTTLAKPDITPPVISDVTILAFSDRQAVLSWKTDEAADTVVEYGRDMGYGKKAEDRTLVTAHQLVLSGLSPSTTYHFRIKATDAVGNGPSISPDFAFMTKATPDTTPPVISGIKVLNVTGTSALVAWDTDEASTGFVEYGTGKGYGISVEGGKFTAHHVLLLQNLTPGRTYHFRVYSTDVSGNRAGPSADSSFFTPKPPPGPDGADTGQAAPIVLVLLLLAGIAVFLFTRARRPSP